VLAAGNHQHLAGAGRGEEMQNTDIFGPFIGMLLLTFVVWVLMYVRRINFLTKNNIHAQRLATPERGAEIIPEEVSYSSNNLKNLFELPVIFYALCLYLYVAGQVDAIYLIAAWTFFCFRVVHSLIQCTVNIVMLRFAAYMISSIALWFMLLRVAYDHFA
jgi:hypothetical protein